jgi:hypothetical protein
MYTVFLTNLIVPPVSVSSRGKGDAGGTAGDEPAPAALDALRAILYNEG